MTWVLTLLAALVTVALVGLLLRLTGGLFLMAHDRTTPHTKTTSKETVR